MKISHDPHAPPVLSAIERGSQGLNGSGGMSSLISRLQASTSINSCPRHHFSRSVNPHVQIAMVVYQSSLGRLVGTLHIHSHG